MDYNVYVHNENRKKRPLWLMILGGFFAVVFLCFMAFVFYLNISLEYHEVKGGSMYPTLNGDGLNEDYVYSSVTKNVERGDIIIYKANESEGEGEKLVIKRLVALGGDCIKVRSTDEIEDSSVVYEICIKISGENEWQVLDDSYVSSRTTNYALHEKLYKRDLDKKIIKTDEHGEMYLEIPEGCFFAIGDNRVTSYDCATYGPVSCDKIHGKVVFVVYDNSAPLFQALVQFFGGKKWK